jgi:tetratricopeptide (TPR) repeat protein
MAPEATDKNFTDYFKTADFWIPAILGTSGLVPTLVGFIRLLRGDFELTSKVFLACGILLSYGLLVYLRYAKVGKSKSIILTDDEDGNSPRFRYSRRARRGALGIGIVLTTILLLGVASTAYYRFRAPRKAIILVADFDGPEPQNYRVTETIIEELRRATESLNDIEIRPLNRVVNAKEGRELARKEGRDQKAAMVLWGWYGKTNDRVIVSTNFEVLQEPRLLSLQNERQISFFPETELESFTLQTQLSSRMTYVVLASIGTVRLEVRDYDGAIVHFSKALSEPTLAAEVLNPSQIYFWRGRAYLGKGEVNKAVSDFNKSLDLTPEFVDAYVFRGVAYAIQGLYGPAISECDAALKYAPDSPSAHLLRGLMWEVLLNRRRAMSDYEAVTKAGSDTGPDYLVIGLAFWRQGNIAKAVESMNHGQTDDPDNSSEYTLLRSMMMAEQGNFEDALNSVNQVLEDKPDSMNGLLIRANIFLLKKDTRNVITDCRSMLKLHPNDTSAYFLLGQAHSAEKRFDRAIDDYSRLIELEPESIVGHFSRGSAYQEAQYFDEAIADYSEVLRLAPDLGPIYLLRGFVYFKKKDFERAIGDYERALELTIDDSATEEAFYYRGQVYLEQKNFEQAIEDFNHALRLKPEDVWAHCTRGLAYVQRKNYESAISDFNFVINHYPEESFGYTLRSVAIAMKAADSNSPEQKKGLLQQADADIRKSETLLKKYDFDINERNRTSRMLGLK